jgi:hypothetical protein
MMHRIDRAGPKKPINPPFQKIGDWYAFKMEVKNDTMTISVEGRQITSEDLGANPDPWLMLHAFRECTAGIRKLRITGNPTIPDTVDISGGPDPRGWRGYNAGGFQKRGEEFYLNGYNILKQQVPEGQPAPKRQWSEQAVFYHRPLMEDGVVEYEFYYEPDTSLVHPAIDRLAFLLESTGVRIHWITDGIQDRSGLRPENVADEPENRRGPGKLPFKEKAWNRMRLTLKGDTVSLNLNGQDIYERNLESTNQRNFGVFHYSDATEVRLRNVTLRGDWAKQLPSPEELLKTK